MATIRSVTFDCAKPMRLSEFWAAALDYVVAEGSDDEGAAVKNPDGSGPRLLFIPVPEGKAVKNRVHFDLTPKDTKAAEVERLEKLGAKVIKAFQEPEGTWTVMQDPEGNEFCVE